MVVIHDSRIEKIMGHGEGVYMVIRIERNYHLGFFCTQEQGFPIPF